MVPTALSLKTGSAAGPRGLAGIAAVAARLAAVGAEDEQLASVIDAARIAVNADECAVWSFALGGLDRMASSGHSATRADEVSAMLAAGESERDRLFVRQLTADDQPLGVLSMRVPDALSTADRPVRDAITAGLPAWSGRTSRSWG